MLGGFLLIGLPGALWIYPSIPFLRLLFGAKWAARMESDRGWPMMIMIALLWPLGILPARYAGLAVAPGGGWAFWGTVAAAAAAGGILTTVLTFAAVGPPRRRE